MKKILMLVVMILSPCIVYAITPETPYLGDIFIPRNVTVSSYTTTAIISITEANKLGDWLIKNNGSYDVFVSTFVSADTSAATVGKLCYGESINIDGRLPLAIYATTEKATSNTCRLDVFLTYKN